MGQTSSIQYCNDLVDLSSSCYELLSLSPSECEVNPDFMLQKCQLSCLSQMNCVWPDTYVSIIGFESNEELKPITFLSLSNGFEDKIPISSWINQLMSIGVIATTFEYFRYEDGEFGTLDEDWDGTLTNPVCFDFSKKTNFLKSLLSKCVINASLRVFASSREMLEHVDYHEFYPSWDKSRLGSSENELTCGKTNKNDEFDSYVFYYSRTKQFDIDKYTWKGYVNSTLVGWQITMKYKVDDEPNDDCLGDYEILDPLDEYSISEECTLYPYSVPAQMATVTTSIDQVYYVKISWVLPEANDAEITKYKIKIAQSDGQMTELHYSSCQGQDENLMSTPLYCLLYMSGLQYSPYNLVQGDLIAVQVQAYNSYGCGTFSEVNTDNGVNVFMHTEPVAPMAPTRNDGQTDDTQLGVDWVALTSESDRGGPTAVITDYQLQWDDGTSGVTWSYLSGGLILTYVQTSGITAGQLYQMKLQACNQFGCGPYGDVLYIYAADYPGAPISLTGSPTSSSITLNWSAPTDNGGSTVFDYIIVWDSGVSSWVTLAQTTNEATTYSVTGLTALSTYAFEIYAVNDVGIGDGTGIFYMATVA